MYERLRHLREDNDLSQKDLSAVLHVAQTTYSDYELAKINIPIEILKQLATFYHTSIDYLMELTDNPNPYEMVVQIDKYSRIRYLRESAELTQREVGSAINVSQRTYSYYESGQRMIPPSTLCALADFYNVSVDYILGRTKNPKTNK